MSALQLLIVGFGYFFLAFALGWWVGVCAARREPKRIPRRYSDTETYRGRE